MEKIKFVDKCIEDCGGGLSKFHLIFLPILGTLFGIQSIFVYGFGFFELQPQLQCLNSDDNQYHSCTKEEACQSKNYKIDYDHEETITNWITKFDLICIPQYQIGVFGSLMLAGFFFGSIFLVRLGDIIGRKKVSLALGSIAVLSLLVVIFSKNIIVLFTFIFIYGLTYLPSALNAYIWTLELTDSRHETLFSSFVLQLDALTMIILGVYFMLVKSMDYLLICLVIQQIIALLIVFKFIPESPKYLFDKESMEEFTNSINIIAKFNKRTIDINEIKNLGSKQNQVDSADEIPQESFESTRVETIVEKEKFTMRKIFQNRVYFINTVALAICWATSSYSFYFTEFYMKYVPVKSIYNLAILMGFSDMVTIILFVVFLKYTTSKRLLLLSLLVLAISSLLIFILILTDMDNSDWIFTVLIFVIRFSSCMAFNVSYYANNEYFPPLLKGGIFAITNVSARLATILSPLVAEWISNPCITVTAMSIIAFIAVLNLKKENDEKQHKHQEIKSSIQ